MSLHAELGGEEIRAHGDGTRDGGRPLPVVHNGNRSPLWPSQPTTLTDGEPTPDAELLVVLERILQAFTAHIAAHADPLADLRGGAHLGEERIWIGLRTEGLSNPRLIIERECRDATMGASQSDECGYLK